MNQHSSRSPSHLRSELGEHADNISATSFPLDPKFFRRLSSHWLETLNREKIMRKTLMLVLVVFAAGVPLAVTQVATAQESKLSEKQTGQLNKRFPKSAETKTYEADSEITATGKRGRPLLGVQRWDMFSGKGATQRQELGYLPGKQGFLKVSQWPESKPFLISWQPTPRTARRRL